MAPIVALPVPGPAAVVVVPIRQEREGDDRQTETRSVGIQGDSFTLIDEREATRINPTPRIVEGHVTPAPVAQATLHVERRPLIELRNQRVVAVRAGANVHGTRGVSVLRAGETERGEQQSSERADERAAAHGKSPVGLGAGVLILG